MNVYDLVGVVAQIKNERESKSHLVSIVNVNSFETSQENSWHLFNDFAVQELTTANALDFDTSWKTPVVLIYHEREYRQKDDRWKSAVNMDGLYARGSLDSSKGSSFHPDEVNQPNIHVAIDAEFVKTREEEG